MMISFTRETTQITEQFSVIDVKSLRSLWTKW